MPSLGVGETLLILCVTCLYSLLPLAALVGLFLIWQRLKNIERILEERREE